MICNVSKVTGFREGVKIIRFKGREIKIEWYRELLSWRTSNERRRTDDPFLAPIIGLWWWATRCMTPWIQ